MTFFRAHKHLLYAVLHDSSNLYSSNLNYGTVPPQLQNTEINHDKHLKKTIFHNRISGDLLIKKLSYLHIEQLIKIDDDLKQTEKTKQLISRL